MSHSQSKFKKRARVAFASVCILGVILLAFAATIYFGGKEDDLRPDDIEIVLGPEEDNLGELVGPPEPSPEDYINIFEGIVASGSTVGGLLQEWLNPQDINYFVESCKDVFELKKLRAGQPFTVTEDRGSMNRFEYEIDLETKLVVSRDESSAFSATIENIEYELSLIKVHGEIESSLFEAMSELGETPALAVRLADIFGWEINFIRDIKVGDSFSVLVEKKHRDGEFKGYGRVLAADFSTKGKFFEAYVFKDAFGKDQFYNDKGESLKRQFLKAPLSFTRISSRFTLRRFHPIHKTWKAHPAVDYAAPQGTPVMAVGDGRVFFVGRGKGAGNYITLKHSNNYETMYLHLSRFAKGLKKGQNVSQGQVIGYVGSTGYSTGPHLDFRMKKSGQWVNPETALSPRAEPLKESEKELFFEDRELYRKYLSGQLDLSSYEAAGLN